MAGVAEHLGTTGAAGYVNAGRNIMPIGTAGVARYTAQGGPAGAIRQHTSDGCYEPTVCSGVNTGFDTAIVADGAQGVARQTGPAFGHAGSTWMDVDCTSLLDLNRILAYLR